MGFRNCQPDKMTNVEGRCGTVTRGSYVMKKEGRDLWMGLGV